MKKIPLAANSAASVRTGYLHNVVNDTSSRAYCGPTAVAAITGEPISRVRDAFRLVRHGAGWPAYHRVPPIMWTNTLEVDRVLGLFGYFGIWKKVERLPTVAAYLEDRDELQRTHPCVVRVSRHFMAVSGWVFCDTFTKGQVVDADKAPGRLKRVKEVFVVISRIEPAAHIPSKAAPVRPPDSSQVAA